jgi:hypothetical protein
MDLGDDNERAALRKHLGGLFTGRKVICGTGPLAGMTDWVRILADAGARRPLLVTTARGAGPVPTEDEAHVVSLRPAHYPTMTEELRDHDRMVRRLPADLVAALERYDPAGEALWWVDPFTSTEPIAGREVAGGRPSAWAALEDKVSVGRVWDAVGQPQSPHRVVAVTDRAGLDAASAELDLGAGVVWVADARDGFNGGGEFTRWVATAEERAAATAFFLLRCDRVRVMPFLEGIPCSIHGLVMPDGTAVFRPVELAILRSPDRRFVYGGQGTGWDPPPHDREQMRALVRRTGEHLRTLVGYRGAFGIDGILTTDGFRPTELNARFAGGLATLARGLDVDLFTLLQLNLSVGRDPGVGAADLEAWALPQMDARRTAQPKAVSNRRLVEESAEVGVSWDGVRLHRDEAGPLTLSLGPTAGGTFTRIRLGDAGLPPGSRIGPLNLALMAFLDEEYDAGFGPLTAPPEVRQ